MTSHKLGTKWRLFYDVGYTVKVAWKDQVQAVADFETVEEFWSIFSHIKKPSVLDFQTGYYFLRATSEPRWDHDSNKGGGKFEFISSKEAGPVNDNRWESLVLHCIGEQLYTGTPAELVCGVFFGRRRPGDKMAVWIGECKTPDTTLPVIGRNFVQAALAPPGAKYTYLSHEDAAKSGSSTAGRNLQKTFTA